MVVLSIIVAMAVVGAAVFWFLIKPHTGDGQGGSTASPSSTVPAIPGTKTRLLRLQVGDCFDSAATASSQGTFAWVVDCTMPHDTEVFFVTTVPDPGGFPSVDVWASYSNSQCSPAFHAYLGSGWDKASLLAQYVHPSEADWNRGSRSLVCYAQDMQGSIEQSFADPRQ